MRRGNHELAAPAKKSDRQSHGERVLRLARSLDCGTAADNVCWINKVADRLGLACDPTENKTDSPLSVRSTGMRIR